jgi:hypothetical protein
MAVARDDLRGDGFGLPGPSGDHVFFDARVDIGEGADGTGDCAGGDFGLRAN